MRDRQMGATTSKRSVQTVLAKQVKKLKKEVDSIFRTKRFAVLFRKFFTKKAKIFFAQGNCRAIEDSGKLFVIYE